MRRTAVCEAARPAPAARRPRWAWKQAALGRPVSGSCRSRKRVSRSASAASRHPVRDAAAGGLHDAEEECGADGELEGEGGVEDEAAPAAGVFGGAGGAGGDAVELRQEVGLEAGDEGLRRLAGGSGAGRGGEGGEGAFGGGGEARGEGEAAGVEGEEPVGVPGEAGGGGGVRTFGGGGEALEGRRDGAGAGGLGGGGHGEGGGRALLPLRAVEDEVAGEDDGEAGAEADAGGPREQAVRGGARRGLRVAGHGRGRYRRGAAHSLRTRGICGEFEASFRGP